MKQLENGRTFNRQQPLYQQVEELYRSRIESGEIACGSKLPSVQALAKAHGMSVFTIQQALDRLAEDGLIDRTRGRGTFVTFTSRTLNNVAVYFGADFWHGGAMGFYRKLCEELSGELDRRGVKHRLCVDTRPQGKHGEPMEEIMKARHSVQGVICASISMVEWSWLAEIGLPLAVSGTAPTSSRVTMDSDGLFDLALHDLRDRGCRTAGLIAPLALQQSSLQGSSGDIQAFFENFTNRLRDFGLSTRNSWVRSPGREIAAGEHEEFGYREFRSLWEGAGHPDGLVVFPDTVAKGVVTGALQESVRVPEDLKLVLHRNEGFPMLYPLEAAWLVTNPADIAASLITMMERQVAGEAVEPVRVQYGFEKSPPAPGISETIEMQS